jgi:hypothetical protein
MHSMRGCPAGVQSLAVLQPLEVLAHVRSSLLAQDIKTGAGQYVTPRSLIQAMVDVIAPRPCSGTWQSCLRHWLRMQERKAL